MPALPINPLQARSLLPEAPVHQQRGPGVAGIVASAAGLAAGIAGHLEHERDAEDNLAITNATSRLRVAAAEGMNDDGTPDGMAERITGRFDKALQGEYARMSPRAQRMFGERQGVQLLADVRARAADAERGARQAKVRVDFEDGVQADARAAFADPTQAVDIMARRLASTDLLPLPEAERDALKSRARQSIASTALATDIQRDPNAVVRRLSQPSEAIQADPVLSSLPAHQLTTALRSAQTELDRRATEKRYGVAARTKDLQTMVLSAVTVPANFAPTVEEYTAIHGADGPARWQQEVGNYLQVEGKIQKMRTASAAERAQIVDEAQPNAGTGFAGGLQMREFVLQARQAVERQIGADPAAYALTNSPRVQEYAYGMEFTTTQWANATPEQKATAVDSFVQVMEAEQLRLGVDVIRDEVTGNKPRGPKLLTNLQVNSLMDKINGAGAEVGTLIQGLEQYWGKHWPKVFSQLAADGRLTPAALVIPNMRNDSSRLLMAQVATLKPDELKALVKPSDVPAIKEETLKAFASAQPSFVAQGPGGNRTLSVVIDQAEKLATLYVSRGMKASAASQQAFNDTLGHAYQWVDTSTPLSIGGREEHYRVPIKFSAEQVGRGANAALEDLVKTGRAKVFAGDQPQYLQPLVDSVLRARSMWITNQDETGLELRLRGQDGGVYAVQGPDGKPVAYSWAELLSRAATFKAVDDKAEGTSEWMRRHQEDINPRRDNPQMSKEQRDKMYGIKR